MGIGNIFRRNVPASAAELQAEKNERQIGELTAALDVKGFPYFLARVQGNYDGLQIIEEYENDPESLDQTIITRGLDAFKVFQQKDKVGTELKRILSNELRYAIGKPLEKMDTDPTVADTFTELDAYLNELAIEHPEDILRLRENLDSYGEQLERIRGKEQELAELTKKMGDEAQISQNIDSLETVQDSHGMFGIRDSKAFSWMFKKSSEEQTARDTVLKRFKSFRNLNKRIGEQYNALDSLEMIERVKGEVSGFMMDLRREMVDTFPGLGKVMEAVRAQAHESLQSYLVEGKNLREMQVGYQQYERMMEVGGDMFPEDVDPAEVEEQFKEAIRAQAEREVVTAVEAQAEKPEQARRSPVVDALRRLYESPSFGPYSPEEARRMIHEVIGEVAQNTPDDGQGRLKRLLLTSARREFTQGKYALAA